MSAEGQMPVDNKAVVQRFWNEVVNQGLLTVADELFAPDCVVHDPNYPELNDREQVKTYVSKLRTAFPDVHVTIDAQLAAEGNHVVTRWTGAGTNTGQIMSEVQHDPTGDHVRISGTSISRVVAGYIEEAWLVMEIIQYVRPGSVEGFGDWWCDKFPKQCR